MEKQKQKFLVFLTTIFLLSLSLVLAAKPDFQAAEVNPSGGHATVTIPANAIEVSPGIFSLGSVEHEGRVVDGIMFIDYTKQSPKKAQAKPGTECGNGVCEPGESANKCPADCGGGGATSSCFSFLANGAKWKTVESYLVNPNNTAGLDTQFVKDNIALDISKWEDAADGSVDGSFVNILGNEVAGVVDGADTASPDNKNEVLFADVSSPGAIAVTIVWGIFSGPPFARELVEWDQVYDDVDFNWSSTGEAGKMDFENIATHEIGHSTGMGHPPDECTDETMFRFASSGETKKRDLNAGDIAGIDKLY